MAKIKILILSAVMALGAVFATAVATAPMVAAEATCPAGSIRAGDSVNSLAECNVENIDSSSDDYLMKRIQRIINVVLSVLGIVTVAMIIIGGIQYTTSNGDAAKVAKAKNTIMYGIIGLIIALLAFAIVNFVLAGVFDSATASSSTSSSK